MSDENKVKDFLSVFNEILTPEQKEEFLNLMLNSKVEDDKPNDTDATSQNRTTVGEDFIVSNNDKLEKRKEVVRARKNSWVDNGEFRDEDVDYEKFEKMKTPRRRGRPKKKEVECHVCGKTFTVNESIAFGEYLRCNRCTGR